MLYKVDHRFRIFDGPVPAASRLLEDEGYCHLPRFFTREATERLRSALSALYEQCPADRRAGSPDPARSEMFRYEVFNRCAEAQRVTAEPRILEIIEPLLGDDCHVISSTVWRNPPDPSHAPRGQEWHTDAGPHIPRSADVDWPDSIPYPVFAIAVHVFVADCTLLDGPTAVIPRSHKSGLTPPMERQWDLDLEYRGSKPVPVVAKAGDVAMFVSDVWHRRFPPLAGGTGRYFLQTNYARRDLAQRIRPTSVVNHTSSEARERARTERERLLIGLHPERFYDG